MKLNKPEITENQTELESYVANLLMEAPAHQDNTDTEKYSLKSVKSNVSDISQSKNMINELVSKTPLVTKVEKHKVINETILFRPKETELIVEHERQPVKNSVVDSRNDESQIDECDTDRKSNTQENTMEVEHLKKINQEVDDYSKIKYQNDAQDPRLEGVEKLLAKISLATMIAPKDELNVRPKKTDLKNTEALVNKIDATEPDNNVVLESASSSFSHRTHQPLKNSLGNVFQTLVFEVNKLPLAVPLIKLGGIINISPCDITPLVGTPSWFMGLVPNEKGNLMVVDTQQFLMPEKKMVESKEYQYLIILDDSQWALACHNVGDAKNLSPEDVRWSSRSSKRPWFAGMVVQYMSALIEVDELINMLANNISD
jgi:chemotaxis signal transduction protein